MKRLFLLAATSLVLVSVHGWQWPVENGVISATFGQLLGGGFSRGVVLSGRDQSVSPASDGELVLRFEHNGFAHPLGNFVLLSHEGGFRTLYGNLDHLVLDADQVYARAAEPLGKLGSSGYAAGEQITFQIIDEELDAFVNPMLILPQRPDPRRPVIGRVFLEYDGQQLEAGTAATVARSGRVTLLAEVYDPSAETGFLQILAPYEIIVQQDQRELRRVTFETLRSRDGRFSLSEEYTVDRLYRSERVVDLGAVEPGDGPSRITITVRDFAGNSTERTVTLEPEP